MFSDLPEYTDQTGVGGWVDRIPQHWGWDPARTVFRERSTTGFGELPMLSVTIGSGVIEQSELLTSTGKQDSSNLDRSRYKLVEPGDLVYNKMRAWQGAAGVSRHRGIVSPAYIVMTPRAGYPDFFHHVVRLPTFAAEAERWSYGITSDQWSLRPEHFKMIRVPVPPHAEQAAIAKYLTHAHGRIDRAIAARRRLIGLLEEHRRTSIERILSQVTVGVDRVPLKRVLTHGPKNGVSPEASEVGEQRTLSLSAIRGGRVLFNIGSTKFVQGSGIDVETLSLRPGDVLVVRGNGNVRLVGRAGLVTEAPAETYIYPDLLIRIRLVPAVDPAYFMYSWDGGEVRAQVEAAARTAVGSFKVSGDDLKRVMIAVPSLAEQRVALARLDADTKPLELAIGRARREIELLQEFRTRLTADVVTGMVDVRQIAAELPDQVESDRLHDDGDEGDDADEDFVAAEDD